MVEWGFATLRDYLEVLIVPILLLLLAAIFPWIQSQWRGRAFKQLILRELREAGPLVTWKRNGPKWTDAMTKKRFVHRTILDEPSENRDFVLGLDPSLVHYVEQLWQAAEEKPSRGADREQ